MTPDEIQVLTKAAEMLESLAEDIFHCNTVDGVWDANSEPDREEHAELIEAASAVRTIAAKEQP